MKDLATNPNEAVVEEEPQSGWSSYKSLLELGFDRRKDYGLKIWTRAFVEVCPKLSTSCSKKERDEKSR